MLVLDRLYLWLCDFGDTSYIVHLQKAINLHKETQTNMEEGEQDTEQDKFDKLM